ncbi:MAG: bifunctional diguanylate cyclase/phosphodiesterase [Immundisolibacteraceae bacterium]|nr:bifunctional diguanylate cyclase/phosphodiesterase [Immundisolibacteraceae bacterium]
MQSELSASPLFLTTEKDEAPGEVRSRLIYAVGAPNCARPSAHWFSSSPGHTLTIFTDIADCQLALARQPVPGLLAIVAGAEIDRVVDFVYQVRSDLGLVDMPLLILAEEVRLLEIMPLLNDVAGIDFAAPASSPELLQARIARLLTAPNVGLSREASPVRLQVVDSVVSRLINSRRRSEQQLDRLKRLLDWFGGELLMFEPDGLKLVYGNQQAIRGITEQRSEAGQHTVPELVLTDLVAQQDQPALTTNLGRLRLGREDSLSIDVLGLNEKTPGCQTARLRYLPDRSGDGLFVFHLEEPPTGGGQIVHRVSSVSYDALTGLPGRALFLGRVSEAAARAKASSDAFSLMVLDIDQFREVNDSLGYAGGDELLRLVAEALQTAVGPEETVARLGDDDFAVLFPQSESPETVRRKIASIARVVCTQYVVQGRQVDIGAGIGVAHYPADGKDGITLVGRAEAASLHAKRDGLGVVEYKQRLDVLGHDQLALKSDLRRAIITGELFLHYQPKVNIRDHRCVGVEALARWEHPQHGFIPPDQFIVLAERAGLIKILTRRVITEALEQAARWHRGGNPLRVAVNLSARNLHEPDLVAFVKQQLHKYSLPPEALQFELTESDIMADPDTAISVIEELHRFGIEFAVDDFGTGYSSLAYLKKLQVSELKIDKSFINQLNAAGDDVVIVHSTITMAHQLGIRVVAEGVENEEIWALLDVLECDIAQGYLISRPASANDLAALINAGLTRHLAGFKH